MGPVQALAGVAAYYGRKVGAHGATPQGVDWSCRPTQELRFVDLMKVCDRRTPFSINDLGCGYGALLGFLRRRHWPLTRYTGLDVSPEMLAIARTKWRHVGHAAFVDGARLSISDYSVASGIFNVKLDASHDWWEQHIHATLAEMSRSSRRGFAANFLACSERFLGTPQLYCTTPERWLGVGRDFGEPELIQRPGLGEFTILVRHPGMD